MDVVTCLLGSIAIFIVMNQLQAKQMVGQQKFFRKMTIGPSLLPKDIISSHQVHAKVECSFQCLKKSTCVGFNYRSRFNNYEANCQLSNKTRERENGEIGEWTFYQQIKTKSEETVSSTVIGSKLNPGGSCKQIKGENKLASSGIYWIKIMLDAAFQVYCDMKTHGGGWTLVYSYTFTDYDNFRAASNAVTPTPNWPSAQPVEVPISTTPPLSESSLGAVDWNLWKNISGGEFMIKSNINNWIVCQPNGGSIVIKKKGDVSCQNVKNVTMVCNNVKPDYLSWWGGPTLELNDEYYYFFDRSKSFEWPTHDPCGKRAENHKKGVKNPGGSIFIR